MVACVAAADAQDAFPGCERNPVSERARQAAGVAPLAVGSVEAIDRIMPHFLAAFPKGSGWEVGAAGDKEVPVAHAGIGCAKAGFVRKWRQSRPMQLGLGFRHFS